MQSKHIIITAPPTHWGLTPGICPSEDRQISSSPNATWDVYWPPVSTQWMGHWVHWDGLQRLLHLEIFAPAFPFGNVDDTKMGGFGRLLDWNISPQECEDKPQSLALCPQGTGIPSAHRPVTISLDDGSRGLCFPWGNKAIFTAVNGFFLRFVEEISSMTCWASNHNWRYAQTGSALIHLTGTKLLLVARG